MTVLDRDEVVVLNEGENAADALVRRAFTPHPLAALFPTVNGEEFDKLCADISKHGLHNPIVLADGVLLDGSNRLRSCESLNIKPTFVEFSTLGLSGDMGLREAEKLISPRMNEKAGSNLLQRFSKAYVQEQLVEIYNGFEKAHTSVRLKRIEARRDESGVVQVDIRTVDK